MSSSLVRDLLVHCHFCCCVRHAANCVSRYRVLTDGRTPDHRRSGRRGRRYQVEFGHDVQFKKATKHRCAARTSAHIADLYAGDHERSGAALFLTPDGVNGGTRVIRQEGLRWDTSSFRGAEDHPGSSRHTSATYRSWQLRADCRNEYVTQRDLSGRGRVEARAAVMKAYRDEYRERIAAAMERKDDLSAGDRHRRHCLKELPQDADPAPAPGEDIDGKDAAAQPQSAPFPRVAAQDFAERGRTRLPMTARPRNSER